MGLPSWNGDWFPLPGQAVFDREQRIASVSRTPENLDLFVIGFDNRVWTMFWSAGGGWNGDWFPLPGQAVFDHQRQRIAAVSRAPENLDLFVIGFDNRVWTTFWTAGGGWNGDWFPLPGQAVFDHGNQHIAAISRTPGHLDLFVIGFDNRVWTTFWSAAFGWNGDWFPLPGQAVFDHQRQHIAAVSRTPENLDLFVLGFDNRAWTTFWSAGGGWSFDWFPLPGQAVFDHQRQHLAAVSRTPGNLDLFVIGFDDRVWTTFWTAAGGWNSDWFPVAEGGFNRDKQRIAAVSRTPENLDLFAIGFDNRAWTTFWSAAGGWSGAWFPLPGQAMFEHDRQNISVVSRTPENLDLFAIRSDNRVLTTFWGRQNPRITLRAIINEGRFIEVDGTGFTPGQTVVLGYAISNGNGNGPITHQIGEDALRSDGVGRFLHPIRINLAGDISGAQAQATDVASGAIATGSI